MPQPTENSWPFKMKDSPSSLGQTGGVVAGVGTIELATVGGELTDAGTLDAGVPDVTPPREALLGGLDVLETAALGIPEVVDGEALNGLPLTGPEGVEVAIGDKEVDKEFGPAELIGIDGSKGLTLDGIRTEADDERLGVPEIAATEDFGAIGVKLTLGPENEGILLIKLEADVETGATAVLVPEPEVEPGIELEVGGTVEEVADPGTELGITGTFVVVATVFDVLGGVIDGVIDGVAVVAVDEGAVVLPKHPADRG